jgi:hypothetical protein
MINPCNDPLTTPVSKAQTQEHSTIILAGRVCICYIARRVQTTVLCIPSF